MSAESYNGWTNYETWGVALLLDNDEGTYNEVREQVATLRENIAADSNVVGGIQPAPPKAPRYGYNQAAHKMDLGRFS